MLLMISSDLSTNTSQSSRPLTWQAAKTKVRGGGIREHDVSVVSRMSRSSAADAGRDCTTYRGVRAKGKSIANYFVHLITVTIINQK